MLHVYLSEISIIFCLFIFIIISLSLSLSLFLSLSLSQMVCLLMGVLFYILDIAEVRISG